MYGALGAEVMPAMKNIGKALVRRATDGKYLILVSSKWPERPDRSQKPDLPGGLVEEGETFEQGCVREVREEAGFDVDPSQLTVVYADSFISESESGRGGQPPHLLCRSI